MNGFVLYNFHCFLCCDEFEIRRNEDADFRIRKPARAYTRQVLGLKKVFFSRIENPDIQYSRI